MIRSLWLERCPPLHLRRHKWFIYANRTTADVPPMRWIACERCDFTVSWQWELEAEGML